MADAPFIFCGKSRVLEHAAAAYLQCSVLGFGWVEANQPWLPFCFASGHTRDAFAWLGFPKCIATHLSAPDLIAKLKDFSFSFPFFPPPQVAGLWKAITNRHQPDY